MKKVLLSSAAILGLASIATPAAAQVKLDLGGYFKGYGAYVDQDVAAGTDDVNDVDFVRDTEIHFGGETTLDNGLTVGAHFEFEADGGDDMATDESYVYMSGAWGRVNLGDEDGAAYLLQVAAPSADENIDGIRQYISPVNYDAMGVTGALATDFSGIDYDQNTAGKSTKITYLTPILNGFQAGVSYTPDTEVEDTRAIDYAGSYGVGLSGTDDAIDETYEGALRYEGTFNNVGMILGAGYSFGVAGQDALAGTDTIDDRKAWNVGADFDIGAFGVGAVYTEDDFGVPGGSDEETIVAGVDYTTGPFKLGASYLTQDNTYGISDLDTDRYSGGVTYTYGPGMTFRGSVGYIEHDDTPTAGDVDATYVTLGTQINF